MQRRRSCHGETAAETAIGKAPQSRVAQPVALKLSQMQGKIVL